MIRKNIITIILIADALLLLFGYLNFRLFPEKAGLPRQYTADINSFSFDPDDYYMGEKIIEFDGKKITKPGMVDFYLRNYKKNDTVTINSQYNGRIIEREVVLPPMYGDYDLVIMACVGLFYVFTGIFILIKFRNTVFSYVIHAATVFTAVMILFDESDMITYAPAVHYFIMAAFECSIFLVPVTFLHFSFTFPVPKPRFKYLILVPFYVAAAALIITNLINLTEIFFFGEDVSKSYFLNIHSTVSDIFLATGLTLTIAKLEHSALTIKDSLSRRQIYWVLLGITFGPLIYVFMILLPRLIMGYELVRDSIMQFTVIVAPVMLLISVTRKNGKTN